MFSTIEKKHESFFSQKISMYFTFYLIFLNKKAKLLQITPFKRAQTNWTFL